MPLWIVRTGVRLYAGGASPCLGHATSLTRDNRHPLDALVDCSDLQPTAAFGPQHGMRGDKRDDMVETPDLLDPPHGIPVFSLYGEGRYPIRAMLYTFNVLFADLQDIGIPI